MVGRRMDPFNGFLSDDREAEICITAHVCVCVCPRACMRVCVLRIAEHKKWNTMV